MGLSNLATGFVTAIPYTIGLIGLVAWGWSSDRRNERRRHLIAATLIGATGLLLAGLLSQSLLAVAAMSMATLGLYGCRPTFWPMPSLFLTSTAAAAGLALINSIGNIGGYVGPFVVGWIKDSSGSFEVGLLFLSGCAFMSALITWRAVRATTPPPEMPPTQRPG
jgi:ACS family tartrate transporter-like MFS transporter